jgi:hypothetical protein
MYSRGRLLVVMAAIAFVATVVGRAGGSTGAVPLADDACPPPVPTLHAVECAGIVPVPSLDPAATEAAWRQLAHGHQVVAGVAAGACRPLKAVFYAATDWRRLATKLAASASPCAQ